MNKVILVGIVASLLSACNAPILSSPDYSAYLSPELPARVHEKRVEIVSQGDYSGRVINGVQLRNLMEQRFKKGESTGFIVHSITRAPYNNTWNKNGWTVGADTFKRGTYNLSNYMELSSGESGTARNLSGWHGFSVGEHTTTQHDSYTGVNAFGVSADVERMRYKGAVLLFGNNQIYSGGNDKVDADIEVTGNMPVNITIDECEIEYVAEITSVGDKLVGLPGDASPTLTNRSDIKGDVVVFKAKLISARLVNKKSREVYPVKLTWVFRDNYAA